MLKEDVIADALAAVEQMFTAPFRAVLIKTAGLTIVVLAVLWLGLERLVVLYVRLPWHWLDATLHVVAGLGLVVAFVLLVPAASFLVAGLFFDELAGHVEDRIVGPTGRGRALAIGPAIWIGTKFGVVSLLVLALALVLLLVPGVNLAAFFGANAYLFGRGFFELAALRHVDLDTMRELRRRHALRIFAAGCVISGLASVPILSLLTPLFAAAFMVRVTQPIVRRALPAQRAV